MTRRLYRSSRDKTLGGVCAGLGYYLELDPNLIRLLTVIAIIATGGLAFLVYLIAWAVMPSDEGVELPKEDQEQQRTMPQSRRSPRVWHSYLPGIILIGIGAFLLAKEYWYWLDFEDLWPVIFIVIGGSLLAFHGTRKKSESSPSPDNRSNQGYSQNQNDYEGPQT